MRHIWALRVVAMGIANGSLGALLSDEHATALVVVLYVVCWCIPTGMLMGLEVVEVDTRNRDPYDGPRGGWGPPRRGGFRDRLRNLVEERPNPNWYEDGQRGTREQWRERCIRLERELAMRRE